MIPSLTDANLQRLTIIESPTTDDYDYDDEFSQFSLDSPDPEDPPSPLSSGLRPGGCHTCEECDKNFSSPGKLRSHFIIPWR